MSKILFLTKDNCHLCATALPLVEAEAARRGYLLELADGSRPPWEDDYAVRLPVVLLDGEVVLEGRFDERDVRKALG